MRFLLVLISVSFLFSCKKLEVFEQTHFFPNHQWNSKDSATFTFNITDTNGAYNIYLVLRHEDSYRYKNIWLAVTVKESDTAYTIQREFTLADKSKWLGSSMDDIIEHRIVFNQSPLQFKKRKYSFTLKQVMREDPLISILNAGIRVQKIRL